MARLASLSQPRRDNRTGRHRLHLHIRLSSSAVALTDCGSPLFSIGSLRKNIGLIALFLFLTTTFGLLGAGKFSKDNSVALTKGGGALGIITAMIAFYVGLAELLSDRSSSWFVLPLGQIPKGRVD
uniref:Protein-tyrosine-phosphatase (EC) n=1 Tax=Ganoderma boninense TaxID=34458 RepID=A0A5K1JYH2_9APHY|nr:Protein-tyrosine-phosphatase (EC [Ganoderma boninense]